MLTAHEKTKAIKFRAYIPDNELSTLSFPVIDYIINDQPPSYYSPVSGVEFKKGFLLTAPFHVSPVLLDGLSSTLLFSLLITKLLGSLKNIDIG